MTYQNQSSKEFFGVLACPEETLWKHLFGTSGTDQHQAVESEIVDSVKLGKEYEMNVQLVTYVALAGSSRRGRSGFTNMSKEVNPAEVLNFLNALFSLFDALCDTHGVHKVETAGDCYIVAGGIMEHDLEDGFSKVLPSHDAGRSASNVLAFAKDMLRVSKQVCNCVSGVIGTKLPKFSIFGDTMKRV
eukprot:gene10415-8364_t